MTDNESNAGAPVVDASYKLSLNGVIGRIVCLPTLPQLARQIALLVEDPKSSAADVSDAIKRDPATAARILRLVNSAYYGISSPVQTVQQAVNMLGFKVIRSIAISTSLPAAFEGLANCPLFSHERFWRHSVLAACLCKSISRKCKGVDPEAAFDAGLLHDIGKLVMACYAEEHLSTIINGAREKSASFDRMEQMVLNTSHGELGAWLAEKWHFPASLAKTILMHHRPCACDDDPLVAILQFANCLCKAKGIRCSGSYEKVTVSPALNAWLSRKRWNIAEFFSTVDKEIENSKSLLAGMH